MKIFLMVLMAVLLAMVVVPATAGDNSQAVINGLVNKEKEWFLTLDKMAPVVGVTMNGPAIFQIGDKFQITGLENVGSEKNYAFWFPYDYIITYESESQKVIPLNNTFWDKNFSGIVAVPTPFIKGQPQPDTTWMVIVSLTDTLQFELLGGPWRCVYSGEGLAIVEELNSGPKEFSLEQNYPNPFNPTTTITFQLERSSEINLKVYDALGREVATLVEGKYSAGSYSVKFDGRDLSSGVYFVRLQANGLLQTRKMILQK